MSNSALNRKVGNSYSAIAASGAFALGLAGLLAVLPGSAAAQDEADEQGRVLEEIVVTARKKEESLQDVPGAVTALGPERLRDLNIESIDDVAKFTPGLSFSKAFGRSTERPVIRGAANILAGTAAHAEAGASYYLNGVYFQGDILSLDMNLVERVEVLKGPQSATYGRNAYSGAVNFVFKDLVGGEMDADVKVGAGLFGEGDDRFELAGSVRVPVNDNFGVMASFRSWEYGGEYTNLVNNQTVGDESSTAVTVGLQFKSEGHDLKAYLLNTSDEDGTRALQLFRSDNNNCFPGFRSNVVKTTATDAVRHGTAAAAQNADNPFQYYCGVVNPLAHVRLNDTGAFTGAASNTDATVPFSGVDRDRTVIMAQYAYDFGEDIGTLNVNFGNRTEELTTGSDSDHWDLQFYSAPGGFPPETEEYPLRRAFFSFASVDEYDDTSIEVRFTSPQDRDLRWSAGLFNYSWERVASNIDWLYRGTVTSVAAGTPANLGVGCSPASGVVTDCYTHTATDVAYQGVGNRSDVDSFEIANTAYFGSVEYDISDIHTVGFELRQASEDKSLRDVATPNSTVAVIAGVATYVSKNATRSFDSSTFRLSYRWRYDEDGTFYASYSTGNKPGGLNNQAAEDAGFVDFDEEESTNIEAGAKHTLMDGRLYLAGTYFINDISKLQLTSPFAGAVISSAVSNQGNAEVSGLEFELRTLIGEQMDLGFTLTSITPEITEGCDPFQYVLTSGGYNYDAARTAAQATTLGVRPGATCDISGKQIPLTSDLQWSLDANWDMPMNNGLNLTWGGNISFESSKFAQVHNGLETGDAMEVGAHVGVAAERWSVRLVGANITDEDAPVALTRWSDYGQGSSCFFNSAGGGTPCADVSSAEFTAAQTEYLQGLGLFQAGAADFNSPRATFASLRQRSRWVVNFTYDF